jgi:Ca2+-binding RTX toxin-like protein
LSNSSAIEYVIGSPFDDIITGNSRDNVLWGRDGKDTITGGAGLDWMWGEGHDDKLFTDALDQVFGGAGQDWFDKTREPATSGQPNPRPGRYMDWGLINGRP